MGTSNWTIAQWLAAAPACGLPSSNFVPSEFQAQCSTVAARHVPSGAPSDFVTVCTASLIARGIIYFKSTPGDCPQPTQLGITDAQITGLAGSAASAGAQIGLSVAGIASMAGAVLPGIGVAVTAISAIFNAHAQAVANEQATICAVAGIINQVFATYDSAVRRGLISPSTAYAGMQTYLNQVNGQLQSIYKSCNASCVYQGILAAHADFVESYYPQIAPPQISAHAPTAAPATIVPTSPGGVVGVGVSAPVAVGPAKVVQPLPQSNPLPLYGDQSTGAVYVLYNGELHYIGPPQFKAGTFPSGYVENAVAWYKTISLSGEKVSSSPATAGPNNTLIVPAFSTTEILFGIGALAILGFLIFGTRKGAVAA
jgi:hypothetical protein